jgi:hypothetical protein
MINDKYGDQVKAGKNGRRLEPATNLQALLSTNSMALTKN